MKPSVCVDLHLFWLAEGRHDALVGRSSLRTIALAAALWDLLDAGLLWGVPGKSVTAARPLPPELQCLAAPYTVIAERRATPPATLWRRYFLGEPSPADQLADDVTAFLSGHDNLDTRSMTVPAPIRAVLIERVRGAALSNWISTTDAAFLLALRRSTFLRDAYFRGRSEKIALSKRFKALQKNPPKAGGWTMEALMAQLYALDEWRKRFPFA